MRKYRPRRTVVLVTAPASEPVTVADVKLFSRIQHSAEDELISSFITAARQEAERFTRRAFINQTQKLVIDLAQSQLDEYLGDGVHDMSIKELYGDLPRVIELPNPPISSITSIVTYDTSNAANTYSASNYYLSTENERVSLTDTAVWPSDIRPIGACAITYVCGYGSSASSVPQAIRTAITITAAKLYENRGLADDADMIPAAARRLLFPYKRLAELI